MLKVGLHLTKNNDKYIELKNRLINQLDSPKEFNFIQLSSDNDIKYHINILNILPCYEIQPDFFGHASSDLKWIQIGAAGIEKSLFAAVLKSKVIITNASGIHAGPVSEYVISSMLFFSKMFRDFETFPKVSSVITLLFTFFSIFLSVSLDAFKESRFASNLCFSLSALFSLVRIARLALILALVSEWKL